ncbi:MAG: cytochrome c oxidase subunit II [Pseudomonadota bacterium]
MVKFLTRSLAAGFAAIVPAGSAFAAQPLPWQMGFQPAATDIMAQISWFEDYTLWLLTPIVILVLGLLAYVIFRYNARANPVPSKNSHNTTIEIIWTVGPVLVLLAFAIPSFQLLGAQYQPKTDPEITIKAIGYQWAWAYEYQDDEGAEDVVFDSIMLKEDERTAFNKTDVDAYPRLLAVDNEIVVPVDTTVRLLVTASDVLHSWAMPAFGVKMDAVPGRLNETWFHVETEGLYYGQCSELCGKDHAYMPIAVRVVSQEDYNSWLVVARDDVNTANQTLMATLEARRTLAQADAD